MKKRYFEKVKPSTECAERSIGALNTENIPSGSVWKGMAVSTGDHVRITTVHGTGAFCKDFDVVDVVICHPLTDAKITTYVC